MSEGGEARNHEAEVEAAVREALDKWLVAWTTPEHRDRIADEILAALDAVRRSPEDEAGRRRYPTILTGEAATAARHAEHGSPQGEDHEAGAEVARRIIDKLWAEALMCETAMLVDHVAVECKKALDALSRCPSPQREDHEAVEDEIDYEMGARVLAAAESIDDEVEPPAPVSGEYRKPDGYCPACGGENDHHPTCDLGRYYRALAKLDGKVHPGWRQAVITQALRPSPEFMKRSQPIIEEGQKMLDDDWDGMAGR